jgi:hypothetical protein
MSGDERGVPEEQDGPLLRSQESSLVKDLPRLGFSLSILGGQEMSSSSRRIISGSNPLGDVFNFLLPWPSKTCGLPF